MTASGARPALVEREAQRLRDAAADDRVGAHRPGLAPLQVHRAAAPSAEALGESADLRQRPTQHGAHVVGQLGQTTLAGGLMTWPNALARNWWWPRCDPLTKSSLVAGRGSTRRRRPPGRCSSGRGRAPGRPPRARRTYSSKTRIHRVCTEHQTDVRRRSTASQSDSVDGQLHPRATRRSGSSCVGMAYLRQRRMDPSGDSPDSAIPCLRIAIVDWDPPSQRKVTDGSITIGG